MTYWNDLEAIKSKAPSYEAVPYQATFFEGLSRASEVVFKIALQCESIRLAESSCLQEASEDQ